MVRRNDGRLEMIAGCAEIQVSKGDAIVIETPTGGGFGPENSDGISNQIVHTRRGRI
jgi:5-oxoprolinase (ATP-hydrolysing)